MDVKSLEDWDSEKGNVERGERKRNRYVWTVRKCSSVCVSLFVELELTGEEVPTS